MGKINIAIDGLSACGKSTTAKAIAREIGYTHVDSGAMYRAVTYYFLENNVSFTNPKSVDKALARISVTFHFNETGSSETFLNNQRVEEEIRTMKITQKVSQVSTLTHVRRAMVKQQKKLAHKKGVVMDGRDIGSVVIPDAELKIFMTADINIRAARRQKELLDNGHLVDFDEVKANLQRRDQLDSTRSDSPLVQVPDAIILDTSHLTLDEQVEEGLMLAGSRLLDEIHKIATHGS